MQILVCVDGSDYTEPSLLYAAWLGGIVSAASLMICHICDVGQYQVPFVNELGAGIGLQPCNGLFGEIQKQELSRIKQLKERIHVCLKETPYSSQYRLYVDHGRPIDALQYFEDKYDYVVFGKRGDSFATDQEQLGANLKKFLQNAHVPCLMSSRSYLHLESVSVLCDSKSCWGRLIDFVFNLDLPKNLKIKVLHSGDLDLLSDLDLRLKDEPDKRERVESVSLGHDMQRSLALYVDEHPNEILILGATQNRQLFRFYQPPIATQIVRECRVPMIVLR